MIKTITKYKKKLLRGLKFLTSYRIYNFKLYIKRGNTYFHHKNGKFQYFTLVNNVRVGQHKMYTNNVTYVKYTLKNHDYHGKYYKRSIDGQFMIKGNYKDGKRHGEWFETHNNFPDDFQENGFYVNGHRFGTWYYWQGKRLNIGNFYYNTQKGLWFTYRIFLDKKNKLEKATYYL